MMMKNKKSGIKYIDEKYSFELEDYIRQLRVLTEAMNNLHAECASIFPGAKHLYYAIKEVKDIIRDLVIKASGLEESIKKELGTERYDIYAKVNEKFKEEFDKWLSEAKKEE